VLTYAPGENVREYILHQPTSAPAKQSVVKFHEFTSPKLGETKVHYGRANDPKYYLDMTHGLHSDEKSFVIKFIFYLFKYKNNRFCNQ
jgi:hypothetical protein